MIPGVENIPGGYAKERITVDLGRGVKITGEGPFEAKLDGDAIRIHVTGRARLLHITKPDFIIRPQYWIDGTEFMANWTDYPSNGWGTYDNTWLIGLSVPDGEHDLVVKNLKYPIIFTRPFTPLIKGVDVEKQ